MGRITHSKIARLAGVSQASVSKALTGSPEISDETRKKILKLAADNGYFEQKKLVSSRHYRPYIAIVVPEIISINYATEATMLVRSLDAVNANGRVYISDFGSDNYNRTINEILQSE